MYELIQLTARDHYIESPARVGLVLTGKGRACLIDSGSDKDAGKKALRHLQAGAWQLEAIYNTHSHADHIGGNAWLQQQTDCRIFAPGVEAAFTCHPILEPSLLAGGCPPDALRHKFLLAQPSRCAALTAAVLPEGWQRLELAGHAMDMAGYLTADGTAYIADSVSSRETLSKYRIGYTYDIAACLDTLERLKALSANIFVPAHAPVTDNIAPLAQYNIDVIHAVAEDILTLAAEPVSTEALLQKLFARYELTMTAQQHALLGSTLRSYLAWLQSAGRITAEFTDNLQLWRRA